MIYIRKLGNDTWHFRSGCQHFKRLVGLPRFKATWRATKPKTGEFCDECKGIAKRAKK